MTGQSLERILGSAARDLLARIEAGPRGGILRTQAAIIRSLIDEIDHRHGSDARVECLHDQAKEEFVRLMQLVTRLTPKTALAAVTRG